LIEEIGVTASIEIRRVKNRRDLKAFVKFPWRVYRNDPNWVPPLIAEQLKYLDPASGSFYSHGEVALFLSLRGSEVVGTIAVFMDHHLDAHMGGFGFFETLDDYPAVEVLLTRAFDWLRSRGVSKVTGPTNFSDTESPGVLIQGADCPPVMMAAHNPLYYKDLLERFGMQKDHDLYAWRAFREQIGEELQNIPPELNRVAEVAQKASNVRVRKVRLEEWDNEIREVHHLFNVTLRDLPDYIPMPEEDLQRIARQIRPFIDPDLALFAMVDGKAVGFCIAIPDVNRVLIHLNGRLFPFNWLRVNRLIKQVDVVTFKMMGVVDEYRRRGIDALLYMEAIKAFYRKGYKWLDGSVTSEYNPVVNLIAHRLGAERYKHYRLYQLEL
jgi:GNAT superfamily N-acetyltransferase